MPNEAATDAWNGDSGQLWARSADQRDRVLAPILDVLLDAAAPQAGESIVDIGCGCGATTLAAARRAGSQGDALGLDLSGPMLDIARRRAADAGLANVTFEQADVQTVDLRDIAHDLVISRFGTMFFDDPDAAFRNIAGALRPGGRLTMVTWQPLTANEWLMLPAAALSPFGDLPDPEGTLPGMFAQSDPDRVRALVRSAGFPHVDVELLTVEMHLGDDVDAAAAYLAELGNSRAILDTLPAADRQRAVDAIHEAVVPFEGHDGVRLEGAILVTAASI